MNEWINESMWILNTREYMFIKWFIEVPSNRYYFRLERGNRSELIGAIGKCK